MYKPILGQKLLHIRCYFIIIDTLMNVVLVC